jgi:hypothetical protein
MRSMHGLLILVAATLLACGKKQESPQPPAAETAGRMGGMGMAGQGMQMMSLMQVHLDSLGAMDPAQLAGMMASHQALAGRMMDAMGADMQGRNMKPDAGWSALSDSVRQDLSELPNLSGAALKSRMEEHIGRMQRMMAMHQAMMKM